MTRVGNFSSSSIYMLMSKGRGNYSLENVGASFHTYVQEKIYEQRLGRPLQNEVNSRATSWGKLVEDVAFVQLKKVINANAIDRFSHPTLAWTGQPDYIADHIVGDIKSPFTLKSFCEMYEIETAEELKKAKPEYYWQLVSNSILTNKPKAQLTIFMPYQSQLELIRELTQTLPEEEQNQYAWINWSTDDELPYIKEGGYYQPIKQLTFEIDENEKQALTARVEMANEILKNPI